MKAAPITPAEPSTARQLTKEDVDAWLDGYMPYALATGDIAGAVVAVVKDGQIVRCPWHNWEFDVTTGQNLADPKRRVRTYDVDVDDGKVYLTA